MIYAFVLVAYVKLLLITESPWLCVGLYTGMAAIYALVVVLSGVTGALPALTTLALSSVVALAYFWSLIRIERGTGTWWAVFLAGAVIMAVVV